MDTAAAAVFGGFRSRRSETKCTGKRGGEAAERNMASSQSETVQRSKQTTNL